MLQLSLFWFLIGLLIGVLANATKLQTVVWVHDGRLSMPVLGGLAALVGGWMGAWVFGSLFGTATAVWVAVVGVVLMPRLMRYWKINGDH